MSAIPVSVKSRISTDNESGDPLLVGQANGADAGSANSIPIESTTDIDVEWIFICQQEHTFTEQRALPDHAITAARMAYKFGDPSSETLYFFDVLRELRDKPSIRDKLSEFSRKSCISCSKHADEIWMYPISFIHQHWHRHVLVHARPICHDPQCTTEARNRYDRVMQKAEAKAGVKTILTINIIPGFPYCEVICCPVCDRLADDNNILQRMRMKLINKYADKLWKRSWKQRRREYREHINMGCALMP